MERHNLLFTGGFDSTFRLCQLSRMEGVEVQPVYLCFSPARFNEKNEIHAQDTILSMLRKRKDTKAVLLSPVRVHEYDLPEAPDLDEAFQNGVLFLKRRGRFAVFQSYPVYFLIWNTA